MQIICCLKGKDQFFIRLWVPCFCGDNVELVLNVRLVKILIVEGSLEDLGFIGLSCCGCE